MNKPIIRYKSDAERVQACHEREQSISWMRDHLDTLMETHGKIRMRDGLTIDDVNLLDKVLEYVITDILHQDADAEYLLGVINEEDE